ncbi:hypothetical protein Tco_0986507 [Tanacetum coccineum]
MVLGADGEVSRTSSLVPEITIVAIIKFFKGSGYQQKDRKPSQNDKTEHGMEKTVQNKAIVHNVKSLRVNTDDQQVKRGGSEMKNTMDAILTH